MTIHEILRHYWGHSRFRPLQEEIVQQVLDGNDTLALLPTGGGKSICFQVPALVRPGICIVVSPLIALMKDQVENLKEKGIKAIAITSGMGKREIDIQLDNCVYGDIKFLYLSPERLLSELVKERIRHMKVNLIAIDEAHCISQWGYDFRPPYLRITALRELHPTVPVLALTATATENVVKDIQEKLGFKKPNVLRKSFERKNVAYVIFNLEDKFRKLFSIAENIQGTGIVYVRNRRETQEVARVLGLNGFSSDFYHAGLDHLARSAKQEAWKKGKVRIMVATNAFGMGIDKPDVRFVVHLDIPESVEAYFQEAGRAGRDEQRAYAVLLYDTSDVAQLRRKLELSFPSVDEIRKIYHQLGNFFQVAYGAGEGQSLEFDLPEFCSRFKLDVIKTLHALKFLEKDGYISLSESVFLPSRVKVMVTSEDLYRFQVEHSAFDTFIKLILRSYGGMFEQYTAIREYDIAKRMEQPYQVVKDMLTQLKTMEIIDYLPQSDKPYLQFVRPRFDNKDLYIDRRYIGDRKAIVTRQVEAVIAYAGSSECRSQFLLSYFNEASPPKCGICDICLEEKRRATAVNLPEQIENEVVQLLSLDHLSLDKLITSISLGSEKERIAVVRNLLDSGRIKTDGTRYYV
ncbi:RecQ family ATP-dependent DNA helicase [Hufsiella ginkgonis]|uniref:ATP-dependent DNA helicase RecQ n=1 Tax=Hufsiella ginkgonis TaxID=2695274 RepID=A0A7K1XYW4_9SPHI|nr:ATP-dependent DNA helicase RecQ [Hufsiella ginkgonis]MXV16185.1 RecQ family ATP-dependent DNA helicase [Hufsiella ginkgonis]